MMKWLLILAIVWGVWTYLRRKPKRTDAGGKMVHDAAEARAILGVSAGDDASTIRAAHRRVLATAHPDRGGSSELAGRANAARDLLLRMGEGAA
ncbi:J domain-containing protein [Sphingomonas sp.]|jgi:hypothetical protein|uniref:J domain-containing protein n=1 Tax=Sphingomonas sp. TaxID=28214 RepID=UPI002ED9C6B1